VPLPPDVHAVTAKGQTYFYFQRNRGTSEPGERHALGKDAQHPDFWTKYNELAGIVPPEEKTGTIARMVTAWRSSPEWKNYSEATRRDYTFYSDKSFWLGVPIRQMQSSQSMLLRCAISSPNRQVPRTT